MDTKSEAVRDAFMTALTALTFEELCALTRAPFADFHQSASIAA